MKHCLTFLLLAIFALPMVAQTTWDIETLFEHVKPMKNKLDGRYQVLVIEPFKLSADDRSYNDFKPLDKEVYEGLAARGLTQWIPPRTQYIPIALALQEAGCQVIFMEGMAFNGPAGENVEGGLHQLPEDFVRDPHQPGQQPSYPCPMLFEGWHNKSMELRSVLKEYKEAGVEVTAAWLDWEIEPYPGRSQWNEAKACARCQKLFPKGVLNDFEAYYNYIIRLRNNLFSTYFAAPFLEYYPKCSMTNWEAVLSSFEDPTPRWSATRTYPPTDLGLFNAANPVAYGNTIWYNYHFKREYGWELNETRMDQLYTSVMLGEPSIHQKNADRYYPEMESIPWVDRYCADNEDPKIPILTRDRYREILRHLWLRGVDGMQIFNPSWFPDDPEKMKIITEEVVDVIEIYDEMLEYRKFLDDGKVMNYAFPTVKGGEAFWSGLLLGDEAIVRTFAQGDKEEFVVFMPFDEADPIKLSCKPNKGTTYLLTLDPNGYTVYVEEVE